LVDLLASIPAVSPRSPGVGGKGGVILFVMALFMLSGNGAALGARSLGDPYEEDEFPLWAQDIRRLETLFIGTIPFAFMMSGLVYDYTYFFQQGMNEQFSPWPLGNGTSSFSGNQLEEKNWALVGITLGASFTLALVDYLLGQWERREQRLAEARILASVRAGPETRDVEAVDPEGSGANEPQQEDDFGE